MSPELEVQKSKYGGVMTQVVRVSRDQVESARLLVKLAGGADKVEPIIAKIAAAEPANGHDKS